jgi:hypothetical protein
MSTKSTHIADVICREVQEGTLTNDDLVQLIELCGSFLNLKTIANYSKENNISYNGAKKCRNGVKLFKVKFIIDNN